MDNSVEFYDISKITGFIKDQRQISLSDAHKIIRRFIDGKIDYKYGCYLCLGYYRVLPSRQDMLSNLNRFFNKIDFNMRDKVDEKQFFLDMLDFTHDLMFKLAFVSDTNENADFNLFFMYREREMKIPADINPFDFYKSIEYGEVISEHPGGCFYKILREIPPKYLKDDKFKQKLKRIADDSLKVLDRADRAHYGRIVPYLSLKIYLYANYDLGSNSDKQNLFDELRSEINAIKYGERIGSWPKKIFFEKQTLYDIAKIFAETKKSNGLDDYCKERNRVLANVLICFQTKDLKEEDFDKLCKIMNQCGTNRFVFERDGSDKDFLPYYVFLPWLKENLFDCKGSVGESKAVFLFEETYVQILASSNFAFDNSTVEYILQSLQKLFEQKQLIITDDRKKSNFYRFTLYLLNSSFESIDTYLLYQQYESMIKKYLNVDDKYLTDNKERRLVMLKSYLDDYAKKFFLEGRAKMLRRQTERCDTKVISELIKKDISEPTKVSELKTVALDKLKEIISYINNNRQFSNWVTNNVMETKERGEYRMDDRNNFDSFLSEDFINNNRQFSNWVTNNVMETKELGQYWMDDRDNFDSFLSEDFIFIEYLDIKKFFDAINFSEYQFETLEDEKGFFKDVLDFMRCLMFNIFSVNDSEVGIYFQKRGVNFNSFFMYCSRECPKSYDKKDKRCGMYDKFLNNEPSGYLAKILGAIPKELLADKVIKQKIKEIADDSLKAFDELDAEKCGLIFPYLFLKIYLYKKYDLAASNQDKQILFNELKEELNSIKNGLRKSNWPLNIIFEKQILYDISEYFEDAVDKKEIADVVRSAIIYCHVQDFSEQDFKWYSDNFETDVKNKTEIKVDRDGQPLKNLFLDETDSKIGYYKLKFIVDSNFIIFDKNRLNDEKFKPFSNEEFDIILKKISNEIMFIHSYVKDGMFCVLCHMLKNMTRDKFSDTVKILFKIKDKEYLDFLYNKYIGEYRLNLTGCLDAIHDESQSEYRKYNEELEKKRKEDLEKKQIETEKKKKQRKKQKSEKIKHNGDSISDSEEESESNEEKKEKKKNKRKDIKEKEKNQTKRKQHHNGDSISDSEEESESNEEKKEKKKNKRKDIKEKEKNQTKRKQHHKEDSISDSDEENESDEKEESESKSIGNKKQKTKKKSNIRRKNNYKLDNSSDDEENNEKEKNKKRKTRRDKHKHRKEESSSDSEEKSKSDEKEKGKKKNKLKNIKFKEKFDENTEKKSDKKKINKHKHRKKENKSESENESEEKIKKKKIRQTKSKEENIGNSEESESDKEKKIAQDKKNPNMEILAEAERNKLNLSKENESIEKSESSNTDKKYYSGSIKYNSVALDSQNKNDNDNEIIDQSCNYKSKPNTEQGNSLDTNNNNNINIQINKPITSNENTYDQTDEEKKEIKEKQQRKEESKPNSEEKSEITKKKAENKEIDKNKQRKKESNSYLKEENESIEKSESSNTDKKDYSGSIKYNSVALDSQNKNDNDNEIIAQSCDGEIKINTEQVNSSNANNDAKIQTNETRISNENAYDQTNENLSSSQDNKNKKLKWTFGIIGTVLFILAFILFFTLALSLAVKIIISLAILIFSMVCFVIVYKIRKLEPPQNLNNGNIVNSEQSFLNDRQKENEQDKNYVSNKKSQPNQTENNNLLLKQNKLRNHNI